MATTASITTGSSSMWQQLQSQQVQRSADQAATTARALQSQANDARAVAEQAQQSASTLEVKASQAHETAAQASQNVQSAKSYTDIQTSLGNLYTNLPQMIARNAQTSSQTQTVAASTGQTVGTIVNTTA